MKIIFAGTPEFSVPTLEKLYDNGFDIELVITQEDRRRGRGKKLLPTPVKKKAMELDIEVFQPKNINSKTSIEKIKAINPDVIIVIAYGQIFSKELLDIPKFGCINIHASLLPKYRGSAPLHWVLINGEQETGVSIMNMEEGLDTGDVYCMSRMKIEPEHNSEDIHDKLSHMGPELLVQNLENIVNGKIKPKEQDHSKASYAPLIFRETGKIDWNKNSKDIINLMRGVLPWPGAYTNYKGETVKIFNANIDEKITKGIPGEIINVSEDGLLIKTKDGGIIVKEIQFPNKKRMEVSEYILGNEIQTGVILE